MIRLGYFGIKSFTFSTSKYYKAAIHDKNIY
jgi:hypothetical protein